MVQVGRRGTARRLFENFKIYLLRQFCLNRAEFFYNTQETQTQKIMDQNVEIRIL